MLNHLLSVRTDDEDLRVRGQLLKGTAGLIILGTLISIISWLPRGVDTTTIGINLSIAVIAALVAALVHFGNVRTGGVVLAGGLLAVIVFSRIVADSASTIDIASYIIPMLIAGLAAGSTGVLVFGGLVFVALAVIGGVLDSFATTFSVPVLLIVAVTMGITWLLVRTLERAVIAARQQTSAVMAAQQELTAQQERMREANAELTQANQQMSNLLDLVRDLEVPVIPLLDGVLVVPVVGHVDTRRAGQLTDAVLEAVHEQRARLVVIDITGVSVVDTAVAQRIVRLTQAVQLLGARVMLTGIRADIAHTMVTQGINLGNIETAGRLQDGLKSVFAAPTYA